MLSIEQRLRRLMTLNLAALGLAAAFTVAGFAAPEREVVDEMDVRRLNIVGADGKPVMVLAGAGRLPGPVLNGKHYSPAVSEGRNLLSGMIFYSGTGDELGGLLYNSIKKPNGYWAGEHLSFDQWRQNQVIALQYIDNGKTSRAGLQIIDRPSHVGFDRELDRIERLQSATSDVERAAIREESRKAQEAGEDGVQRLFLGSQDRTAMVQLKDSKGRVRAQLKVGADDVARLEFLDAEGHVVATYPGSTAS